ncbi:MAG TPA: DUF6351 family protein [Solirubrobacteraceae bacterium]|nr:DUF6351 family protein [Solirubrobacteraceae bacterium]
MRKSLASAWRARFWVGLVGVLLLCLAAVPADAARRSKRPALSISVLSGRADLVSGGSALVAINLPRSDRRRVKVTLGRKNVTRDFAIRQDGHFEGLVTGLHLGRNVLQATLRNGWATRITLVNHSAGGPLFSGPQLEPWICEAGATDAKCDQAPTFTYEYMSTNPSKHGFQPYDPSSPPSDVAQTTTDQGVTVPFIVRTETGYMDRDQYQISVLDQPGKPWSAVAPQRQFDHKLLILHGASCGVDHQTGTAPATTGDAAGDYALGKGFMTMSAALDNSGHNCNLPLQAESLIMAKEHAIKSYGTLRYTIGTGCSGGSLAQQWIANAYPGVYQGILPTCSFPDAWSTATQFLDYHLLLAYFLNTSKWGLGVAWTPAQMGDVLGGPDGLQNAEVSDEAQFHVAVPTDPCNGTTDADRYNPQTNPGGIRCTIQDAAVNVFGPEPKALWSPNEVKVGHGFVRPPIDNVGVQYGLAALESGAITPADFVDLNVKIGGLDIDANPIAARDSASSSSLARAYRSGMINETNNLNQTAIIDCRGPNPGLFHDAYRAFAVRARLDREHGTHANQLIWEGPVALIADKDCELNSFIAMDQWLTAVERDHSRRSLPQKIIRDKPSGLSDECWDGSGTKISNSLCPAGVVNVEGTPRTVAGDSITTDDNKCQLKPLSPADYPGITFTPTEWTQLQQTFPSGVCDYSKPGVDQQPTIPWLTYQNAKGGVIYGGKPMGAPPASREFHVATGRPRG